MKAKIYMKFKFNRVNDKIFDRLIHCVHGFEYSISHGETMASFDESLGKRYTVKKQSNNSIHAAELIDKYFEGDAEVFKKFLLALFDEEVQFEGIYFDRVWTLRGLNQLVFSWTRVMIKYGHDFSTFDLLLSQDGD